MQYPTNFLVIDFQSQSSQLQSIRYFQIIPHDVEKFIARDIYNRYLVHRYIYIWVLWNNLCINLSNFIYVVTYFCRSVMSDSLQPMDCSTPGFPVLHPLPELLQTHVHWVSDILYIYIQGKSIYIHVFW